MIKILTSSSPSPKPIPRLASQLTSLSLNQSSILIPIPKSPFKIALKSNPNWESKNLDQPLPFYYAQTRGRREEDYSKAKE